MYIEGHRQYKYHLKTCGHPSKFGFKDIIPTWKAEKFDPEHLMALYKRAGAKYFVSMGVHHDNFDLWDSKWNKWNSVNMGPQEDIVGLFRKAALKEGLRFGVSEHLAVSYHWFQTSHGADKEGSYKGVPYDGADSRALSDNCCGSARAKRESADSRAKIIFFSGTVAVLPEPAPRVAAAKPERVPPLHHAQRAVELMASVLDRLAENRRPLALIRI